MFLSSHDHRLSTKRKQNQIYRQRQKNSKRDRRARIEFIRHRSLHHSISGVLDCCMTHTIHRSCA